MQKNELLQVFLKIPAIGKVKTRLARKIGKSLSLEAYKLMVHDLLYNLTDLQANCHFYLNTPSVIPFGILFALKNNPLWYERMDWLSPRQRYQRGDSLGERMTKAFTGGFHERYRKIILIGSDIPHLNARLISRYFQALDFYDFVIGPATDGGYYLIGFNHRSFAGKIFADITWSTKQVYSETLAKAAACKLSCFQGPLLNDIDTLNDLQEVVTLYGDHLPGLKIFFNEKLT